MGPDCKLRQRGPRESREEKRKLACTPSLRGREEADIDVVREPDSFVKSCNVRGQVGLQR